MGWTDKIKEGAKEFLNSDLGKEAAQIARDKAQKGLDSVLGAGSTESDSPADQTDTPADQPKQPGGRS